MPEDQRPSLVERAKSDEAERQLLIETYNESTGLT